MGPRAEDEPLSEYKGRLSDVAEAMAKRSFVGGPNEPSWREAREKELEGRVGDTVKLVDGSEDTELIGEADGRALTWDNILDRSGAIRWPAVEPRGKSARYGVGQAAKGGVASPESLRPTEDSLRLEPGYVLVEEDLWYVPGDLDAGSLQVPSGTEKTVIVPWHIESQHPHRIEAKSADEVRLVGADGHEHVIHADGYAQPEQVAYSEAGSGRAQHTHDIEQVNVEGPVFAQTRPHAPTSNTGGGTLDVTAGSTIAPGRPAQVPNLHTETVTTEPDSTEHQHEVLLSPHEYWSGDFVLPGDSHSHVVDDWVVQEAGGHQHVINKPPIPDNRALIPRLTRYEGKQLLEESESPSTGERAHRGRLDGRLGAGGPLRAAPPRGRDRRRSRPADGGHRGRK